ncbi:hypothetical protein CSX04_02580 [Burkholderia cepacia]|nr:hypothetical protein CSX04_02580 [Burkholderia cepacia]
MFAEEVAIVTAVLLFVTFVIVYVRLNAVGAGRVMVDGPFPPACIHDPVSDAASVPDPLTYLRA